MKFKYELWLKGSGCVYGTTELTDEEFHGVCKMINLINCPANRIGDAPTIEVYRVFGEHLVLVTKAELQAELQIA